MSEFSRETELVHKIDKLYEENKRLKKRYKEDLLKEYAVTSIVSSYDVQNDRNILSYDYSLRALVKYLDVFTFEEINNIIMETLDKNDRVSK